MGTWLVHMKSHYAEGQEAPRAVGGSQHTRPVGTVCPPLARLLDSAFMKEVPGGICGAGANAWMQDRTTGFEHQPGG